MTKQISAVEWLIERLIDDGIINVMDAASGRNELYAYIQQAKQMQRQQHGNTWDAAIEAHEQRGHVLARSLCDFDDYYKNKYEKENATGEIL